MSVEWNSDEIIERVRGAAVQGVTVAIHLIETEAIRLITQTGKTGRRYRRRGIIHQASAPGEPPATDTGTLVSRRSVEVDPSEIMARLSFHAGHAPLLEYGTVRMEPRPFARPAAMNMRDQAAAAVGAEISLVIR